MKRPSPFPQHELGFRTDNRCHLREEMEPIDARANPDGWPTRLQFPMLKGPADIPWQVEPGYSESAQRLCTAHRELAYAAAFARNNFSYARYLGIHLPRKNHRTKSWAKVMTKTRRTLVAGGPMSGAIQVHREFLMYLGELHVQVTRCLENRVNLYGTFLDLRLTRPTELREYLDGKDVPQTNEINWYSQFDWAHLTWEAPNSVLINKWSRQEDEQINRYHVELGIHGKS
jgi:hypothetical protein